MKDQEEDEEEEQKKVTEDVREWFIILLYLYCSNYSSSFLYNRYTNYSMVFGAIAAIGQSNLKTMLRLLRHTKNYRNVFHFLN